MTAGHPPDIVDLLVAQHQQIETMAGRVKTAGPGTKQAAFEDLVRLLAVHESTEEMVVHPTTQRVVGPGSAIVADRLAEETGAKHVLAELCRLGADHPGFDARFAEFADSVSSHAEHEEREEFPQLRKRMSPGDLLWMAGALRAAEAAAPVFPYRRRSEPAAADLLGGSAHEVFDRVRVGVRDWLGTRL